MYNVIHHSVLLVQVLVLVVKKSVMMTVKIVIILVNVHTVKYNNSYYQVLVMTVMIQFVVPAKIPTLVVLFHVSQNVKLVMS